MHANIGAIRQRMRGIVEKQDDVSEKVKNGALSGLKKLGKF